MQKVKKVKKGKEANNKITKVQKRDGRVVEFEQAKITDAVHKAITSVGHGNGQESRKISNRVVDILFIKKLCYNRVS